MAPVARGVAGTSRPLPDTYFDPTKDWYDRSSLKGDFMVMIPDQTVEDYLRRAPENQICEFIDGVVYMPSPASLWHQFDLMLLSFLLRGFTARHPVGHLLSAPASLRVGENRFLEPDLFVRPQNPGREFQGFFVDPPRSVDLRGPFQVDSFPRSGSQGRTLQAARGVGDLVRR